MNSVILIGRMTSDPSIRDTEKTKIASFRLAVPRPFGKDETDFISCKAFGKTAEFLENYASKGNEIAVNGRIETGSYKNKDGNTVYTTDILCDRVEFTHGSKGAEKPTNEPAENARFSDPSIRQMTEAELPDSFEAAEDDIPF